MPLTNDMTLNFIRYCLSLWLVFPQFQEDICIRKFWLFILKGTAVTPRMWTNSLRKNQMRSSRAMVLTRKPCCIFAINLSYAILVPVIPNLQTEKLTFPWSRDFSGHLLSMKTSAANCSLTVSMSLNLRKTIRVWTVCCKDKFEYQMIMKHPVLHTQFLIKG